MPPVACSSSAADSVVIQTFIGWVLENSEDAVVGNIEEQEGSLPSHYGSSVDWHSPCESFVRTAEQLGAGGGCSLKP